MRLPVESEALREEADAGSGRSKTEALGARGARDPRRLWQSIMRIRCEREGCRCDLDEGLRTVALADTVRRWIQGQLPWGARDGRISQLEI